MIKLKIENWKKYNPRLDVTKSSWLRLEHDLFDSPQLTDFSNLELLAFIYVLCMASKENKSGEVIIWEAHASKNRVNESSLHSCIKKLESLGIVTVDVTSAYVDVRARTNPCTTRRTNETNETNETDGRDIAALRPISLQNLWNNQDFLPRCKVLSASREKKAKTQIKLYPDESHWVESLKKLVESRFCVEEWKPGFDDWLDEKKRLKAIEGKYDDKRGAKTFNQARTDANKQAFNEIDRMVKNEF